MGYLWVGAGDGLVAIGQFGDGVVHPSAAWAESMLTFAPTLQDWPNPCSGMYGHGPWMGSLNNGEIFSQSSSAVAVLGWMTTPLNRGNMNQWQGFAGYTDEMENPPFGVGAVVVSSVVIHAQPPGSSGTSIGGIERAELYLNRSIFAPRTAFERDQGDFLMTVLVGDLFTLLGNRYERETIRYIAQATILLHELGHVFNIRSRTYGLLYGGSSIENDDYGTDPNSVRRQRQNNALVYNNCLAPYFGLASVAW